MDGLDQRRSEMQNTEHGMQKAGFAGGAAQGGLTIGGGFEVVLHEKQVI